MGSGCPAHVGGAGSPVAAAAAVAVAVCLSEKVQRSAWGTVQWALHPEDTTRGGAYQRAVSKSGKDKYQRMNNVLWDIYALR